MKIEKKAKIIIHCNLWQNKNVFNIWGIEKIMDGEEVEDSFLESTLN